MLRGRIQERNAGPLARSLDERGVSVERVVVVGDEMDALVGALRDLLAARPDLICVSGGLGPTHDDRTMAALAEATGQSLAVDPGALLLVRAAGAGDGVDPATTRVVQDKQASLPQEARFIAPVGTAPGCFLEHGGVLVVVLPGPPWELAAMWCAALSMEPLSGLLDRARPPVERVLRIHAVPESRVVAVLDRMDRSLRAALALGICARDGELELTIRARDGDAAAPDALERALAEELGDALYSRDGTDLDTWVARILDGAGQTLSVAESCTGGGLGERLSASPGSSRRFLGGVIAYADAVKTGLLGVDPAILVRHGAVSAESARAMARGARERTDSDWALSITGVAGPGGGSPYKPVGLVYIGLAGVNGEVVEEHRIHGDRERVRQRSAALALHLLRRGLTGEGTIAESWS